jgi:excisionase family DNA binding protein
LGYPPVGDLGGIVATGGDDGVVFPPDDLEGVLDLATFMEHNPGPGLLLGPGGEQVPLPKEVYTVLVNVVQAMRQGKTIGVLPLTQRMTTQEAADFLGISRPTFVKLLERGEIPFEQPRRHRRVFLSDLLAYQRKRQPERRATLKKMTEEASETGIYEGSPADYVAALKAERKRLARNRS